MKPNLFCCKRLSLSFSLLAPVSTMLLLLFSSAALAQGQPEEPEIAICKIKANNRDYQSRSNDEGYFMLVSAIPPKALIPIEVIYPGGKAGEKVVLTAVNDGFFDNKKQVKVVQLDRQKKCTFTFQLTSHPGLFEVVLRKGADAKVVQLWVGKE
jgi:hypothetical protein